MGAAKKIVEELKAGVSPEELARKITWKELSGDDGEDLLAVALRLGDNQQSYNLLVYLFHISFGKDLWYSTEVLSQAVQHPNMTLLDRKAILPTMRSRLDQIKDQIGTKTPAEEKLTKYWLMEATYYSVNGNLLSETGNRVEATHNYQIAQSIFEQLGLFQKAAEYKTLNRRLLSKDAGKSPLPKTSPIRMPMPATQPISLSSPQNQPQPKPAEPASAVQPEKDIPPFIDQDAPSSAIPQPPAAQHPGPFITEAATGDLSSRPTSRLVSPEQPAGESVPPAAGSPVNTISMAAEPKKLVEVTPTIPQEGAVKETVIQLPEPGHFVDEVQILPSNETVLITPPPEQPSQTGAGAEPPVLDEQTPAQTTLDQPTPLQPVVDQPAPVQPTPPAESPSVTGIYYPLPDVWLEEGRLHILGVDHFKGDEAADQSEQIRQQCDILIGIQLQIKMYQTRRRMLDQEMKLMESKANALRARIEKLENKAIKLESAKEISSS
jgi:hypothetical protein